MNNAPICPDCDSVNESSAVVCATCGRQLIVIPTWVRPGSPKKLLRRNRIVLWPLIGLIIAVFTWFNYPYIPNLIVVIFNSPTSDLSSSWYPGSWPMRGGDLSGSGYVPWTGEYPEGVRSNSFYLGPSTRSAPIISNGTIYLGSESEVSAIDAETGKPIWTIGQTGPVHGTLAIADETVFVPLRNKELLAISASSGIVQWSFKSGSPFVGAPSVDNGIVYSSTQKGRVHALDAATGSPIWTMDAGDAIAPAVALVNDKIAIGVSSGGLFIKDARTGDKRSRVRIGGLVNHPPVVGGNSVYLVSNGKVLSFDVNSRELPWSYPLRLVWTQLWLWQLPVPTPPVPAGFQWQAIPAEGGIEPSTNAGDDFEPKTLVPLSFENSLIITPNQGSAFVTAPAATSNAIYIGSNNNFIYSISADSGKTLWRYRTSSTPVARPTVVGERLYFGTSNGTLHSVNRVNGQGEWSLELGSPLTAPITFASGILYARTEDGTLHKIR